MRAQLASRGEDNASLAAKLDELAKEVAFGKERHVELSNRVAFLTDERDQVLAALTTTEHR